MLWLGILLVVLALGLIAAEFFTGSGLLLIGGIAALIVGLIVLFTGSSLITMVDWWVAAPLIILLIALLVFIIWKVVKIHQTKVQTGKEEMIGSTAVVKRTLDPEGTVLYAGELWNARSSSGKIELGEEVIITTVERLNLTVTKKDTQ